MSNESAVRGRDRRPGVVDARLDDVVCPTPTRFDELPSIGLTESPIGV